MSHLSGLLTVWKPSSSLTQTNLVGEQAPTQSSNQCCNGELEFIDEIRSDASLREVALKQKIATRHNKKVINREFKVSDLVLRRNQKDFEEGKLAANWEGPYIIMMKMGTGACGLEDFTKGPIPRTWNAEKLKRY